jgi:hypothetical protein
MFKGEPVVGLSPDLPLYRRVQLAVLAHIRHTHTRYDLLLKETTWENARKAVEPICLDFLVKWRGDEETGRDQLDEILREVVIITDSEDSDDSSEDESDDDDDDDDSSSDEEGELSATSSEGLQPPISQPPLLRSSFQSETPASGIGKDAIASNHAVSFDRNANPKPRDRRENKTQRGFSRYRAAWDQAVHRQAHRSSSHALSHQLARNSQSGGVSPPRDGAYYDMQSGPVARTASPAYGNIENHHRQGDSILTARPWPVSPANNYHAFLYDPTFGNTD